MGFDCASTREIQLALDQKVPNDKIIYANTCKAVSHLKFAKENGVKKTTFDSEFELLKIKEIFPEAELVIRLSVEEFDSKYSFKDKFGVSVDYAKKLLQQAKILAMNVIGVSFHVGSHCKNPAAYYSAIKNCREVFDFAKNELDWHLSLLDIGGGFLYPDYELTGQPDFLFENSANMIKDAIIEFFPENVFKTLQIISEPGAFFCQSVFHLAVMVIGKKLFSNNTQVSLDESDAKIDKIMYYVNEGVYSAFINVLFGDIDKPRAVFSDGKLQILDHNHQYPHNSIVWGPTCSSFDRIFSKINLPVLEIGDWIIFENFGSYTMSLSTDFNNFPAPQIKWI